MHSVFSLGVVLAVASLAYATAKVGIVDPVGPILIAAIMRPR